MEITQDALCNLFADFVHVAVTMAGNYKVEDTVNFALYIPETEECFTPSLAVIPLQLLGYYVSVSKGLDVDKPRNLAKSVTVE